MYSCDKCSSIKGKNAIAYKHYGRYVLYCEHRKEILILNSAGVDNYQRINLMRLNLSDIKDKKDKIDIILHLNKIKHFNVDKLNYLDISDNPIRSLKTEMEYMYVANTKIKNICVFNSIF